MKTIRFHSVNVTLQFGHNVNPRECQQEYHRGSLESWVFDYQSQQHNTDNPSSTKIHQTAAHLLIWRRTLTMSYWDTTRLQLSPIPLYTVQHLHLSKCFDISVILPAKKKTQTKTTKKTKERFTLLLFSHMIHACVMWRVLLSGNSRDLFGRNDTIINTPICCS